MPARRFGLSFEMAPPSAVHPNRTDIACFIGTVARRRAGAGVSSMPEVLVRWLEEGDPALVRLPLRSRRVDLRSAESLQSSLAAALVGSNRAHMVLARVARLLEDAPRPALNMLLQAFRTFTPVPAALLADLHERGFSPGMHLTGNPMAAWLRLQLLHDLPVSLDNFETFDALFAWEARPVLTLSARAGDPQVCTALGAAVRAFFGEGGQRCYVLRSGDPVPLFDSGSRRFGVLNALDAAARARQPGGLGQLQAAPAQPLAGHRAQLRGLTPVFSYPIEVLQSVNFDGAAKVSDNAADWCGLEHLYGLPDVSFVGLPDLADAVSHRLDDEAPPQPADDAPTAFFSDCEEPAPEAPRPAGRLIAPPRARNEGLQVWIALVRRVLDVLDNNGRSFNRRDVQLLVSLPLAQPERGAPQADDWLGWMARRGLVPQGWWSDDDDMQHGEPFARVQVAYPWLVTLDSEDCPGALEAPEGTLAGVLARNALARGAFRSAAMLPLRRYVDAEPALRLSRALDHAVDTPAGLLSLAERVCLFGPSPRGPLLWSDVSLASQAMWRPGSVRRLVNVVINAARRAGEEFSFEANGEILWAQLRQRLGDLGRELLAGGALSGDAGARAFVVRCGRDTMSQADLDAGRLLAEIELVPAQPIMRIQIVLALRDAQPLVSVQAAA